MNITMNDAKLGSIAQLQELVKLSNQVEFKGTSKDEVYAWMTEILGRFRYFSRDTTKKGRGIIISYLETMTGLSRSQIKKLIKRKKQWGQITRITGTRHRFPRVYGPSDIARLIETDNLHERLSGQATKRILAREYEFGDERYELIHRVSVSHLYNLRGSRQYDSQALFVEKTRAVSTPIGIRKKPQPDGRPGYLRVDSVHQGDEDKVKGVYHINLVDEVTQWEIVGCVEGISEYFLAPLLETLLGLFPFIIRGFHSDNGGEYINRVVAALLAKVKVEQTKSRSRRTNDNALVESKNGAVIRKHLGHAHIPGRYAKTINGFYRAHLDDYLNFHRPCGFATNIMDERGKIKKQYDHYLTPFEKLKAIKNVEQYLRPGVSLAQLTEKAGQESDNTCAKRLQLGKKKLKETLHSC